LKCDACHLTCGTCSGPNNNQCLTCSDVTYNFKNGTCCKDSACPKGLYQKGASCSPCSTYCADCVSDSTCNQCIEGFQM
jgi:proprotein convertase subtilisin/kexin type 5